MISRPLLSGRRNGSAALLAAVLLSGCTSIEANQRPVTIGDIDRAKFVCPTDAQLAAAAGANAGLARNRMVMECVKAIDAKYLAFKVALHREAVGSNLAVDILSLGLSTGASFAGQKAAQRLSAGSAFVLGSGAAINKDIFYQQTLPALEASMDTQRDRILKRILDAEAADTEAKRYGIIDAGFDLARYEQAGNLYAAIAELTKNAAAAAEDAQAKRSDAEARTFDLGAYQAIDPDVQSRFRAFDKALEQLKDPADRPKLDALAGKLGVGVNAQFDLQREAIFEKLYHLTHVSDASTAARQLDSVEPLIR